MWTSADARRSREATCRLVELAEEGVLEWETLARDLMGWMSDNEVQQFALANDYIADDEDEEEEE